MPVAVEKVKFCRVVEPETRRSPAVLMVVVAVPPILKVLAVKNLVKKLVVVALVSVALAKITLEVVRTFWSIS